MEALLDRQQQESLIDLIQRSGLCKSSEARRAFLIQIHLPPEEENCETQEHLFLTILIDRLAKAGDSKSLSNVLDTISHKISLSDYDETWRVLKAKLSNLRFKDVFFQPAAKPAYFAENNRAFQFMPLDIGTIWGLQRSSFIGLLIGFEGADIYENLEQVELALFPANKEPSTSLRLPKRKWKLINLNSNFIQDTINGYFEEKNIPENNSSSNSTMPGFVLEVDVKKFQRINRNCEDIKNFCSYILKLCYFKHHLDTAIVINLNCVIDIFTNEDIKKIKNQLQEIAKEIPVELMRLDRRPFFTENRSHKVSNFASSIQKTEKTGLIFCFWMHQAFSELPEKEKTSNFLNNYKDIIDLYETINNYYQKEDINAVSVINISAIDVVIDIPKSISNPAWKKVYEQILKLVVTYFPKWSYEWIAACAKSNISEAVEAGLAIAASNEFRFHSDIFMDAWIENVNIDKIDIDLICSKEDSNNIWENLFLALLRSEKHRDMPKTQTLLQNLARGSLELQALYNFFQERQDREENFLNQNDPNQFMLAIRAKIKFKQAINRFKTAPASRIPIGICWLLGTVPPSKDSITELLQLEPTKRAVFGLCTSQEWQKIETRLEKKQQILDYRRNRDLKFIGNKFLQK